MMRSAMIAIEESNLSLAWARAFLHVNQPGVKDLSPLTVSITGFVDSKPAETPEIRQALDTALRKENKGSCQTVASTIFPTSMWNPELGREQLFKRYHAVIDDLRKIEHQNCNGLYFERLVAFGSTKINQLEHIIRTYWKGNHRRSALQASIFDPAKDHSDQRQRGFPCMQQVAFAPSADGGLTVTAFYATQYLFERAYGNYLGLCDLGRFVAHELDLKLTRMTCMVGNAQLGKIGKRSVVPLCEQLQAIVLEAEVAEINV